MSVIASSFLQQTIRLLFWKRNVPKPKLIHNHMIQIYLSNETQSNSIVFLDRLISFFFSFSWIFQIYFSNAHISTPQQNLFSSNLRLLNAIRMTQILYIDFVSHLIVAKFNHAQHFSAGFRPMTHFKYLKLHFVLKLSPFLFS